MLALNPDISRFPMTLHAFYGGQDPRLMPIYSLAQAAPLAGVSASTLRSWVIGRSYPTQSGERFFEPVIEVPDGKPLRLAFTNAIEAHILSSLRTVHQMPLDTIRAALGFVERELQTPHPLAARVFQTDGITLFVEHLGSLVDAASGQIHFRELLEAHLSRVEYDGQGHAVKLFPFVSPARDKVSLHQMHNAPRAIVVSPLIAFGRPLVNGSGVPVEVLWNRFLAGEEPQELAADYALDLKAVHDVLRYEQLAA